jgi:hypothetical protein
MYPGSLSVLKLPRSLEFEHEVRREMALQAMRCFGQVDDADGQWKMDVEKVVRQVSLGILRQYRVGFGERFLFPPSFLNPHSILTLFLAGAYFNRRVTQISEDGIPPSAIPSFSTHPSSCSR